MDEIENFANAARGGAVHRLRLGVIPTIAPYLLPTLIGHLTNDYPGIDINIRNIRETLTEKLVRKLISGSLDKAMVALPISAPALCEMSLFCGAFVLIRPAAEGYAPAPEMATALETRSALVSVSRFAAPEPTRTIGMIWRKTSPLGRQLEDIAERVKKTAEAMRPATSAG